MIANPIVCHRKIFKVDSSREQELIENFSVRENETAIAFGKYDREDSTLVTVYKSGGIEFHIVRRKANFARQTVAAANTSMANIKMPRMSQSYLEQIEHEKKNANEILKHFQYDLSYVRLLGAHCTFVCHEFSCKILSRERIGSD